MATRVPVAYRITPPVANEALNDLFDACGFEPTEAGVLWLARTEE